ncbi:hypothetical protein HMPREF3229_00581 [Peptoniphilus harei]|uniref:Uncharacterized protein n=1 Tax=Peptoniphilus harei TaxID=54005 RepID=A0A133PQQ4_9FIRM|nr:hypothetical protein HMPREF3229_00581 [Peptoniphilus harei]
MTFFGLVSCIKSVALRLFKFYKHLSHRKKLQKNSSQLMTASLHTINLQNLTKY